MNKLDLSSHDDFNLKKRDLEVLFRGVFTKLKNKINFNYGDFYLFNLCFR